MRGSPLLRVVALRKAYATPQGPFAVLKGVDLSLDAGSALALSGESGSGKSTLLHLTLCSTGQTMAKFGRGVMVTGLSEVERAALRREILGSDFSS